MADATAGMKPGNTSGTPSVASALALAATNLQGILQTLHAIDTKMSSIAGKAQGVASSITGVSGSMPASNGMPPASFSGLGSGAGSGTLSNGMQRPVFLGMSNVPAAQYSRAQYEGAFSSMGQASQGNSSGGAPLFSLKGFGQSLAVGLGAQAVSAMMQSAHQVTQNAYGQANLYGQISTINGVPMSGNGANIYRNLAQGFGGSYTSKADLNQSAEMLVQMGQTSALSPGMKSSIGGFANMMNTSLHDTLSMSANQLSNPFTMMMARAHGINMLNPNGSMANPIQVLNQTVQKTWGGRQPTVQQVRSAFTTFGPMRQNLEAEGLTPDQIAKQEQIVVAWAATGHGDISRSNTALQDYLNQHKSGLTNSQKGAAEASALKDASTFNGTVKALEAVNKTAETANTWLKDIYNLLDGKVGDIAGVLKGLVGGSGIGGIVGGLAGQAANDFFLAKLLGRGGASRGEHAALSRLGKLKSRLPGFGGKGSRAAGRAITSEATTVAEDTATTTAEDVLPSAAMDAGAITAGAAIAGAGLLVGGAAIAGTYAFTHGMANIEDQIRAASDSGATADDVNRYVAKIQSEGYYRDPRFKPYLPILGDAMRKRDIAALGRIVLAFKERYHIKGRSEAARYGGASGGSGLGQGAATPGSSKGALAATVSTGNAAAVIAFAKTKTGTPYSWGGGGVSGPSTGTQQGAGIVGFDCSSFVQFVFAHFGIMLPRTTYEQVKRGHAVAPADVQPGDLVFFATSEGPNAHVGIAISASRMINAPYTGVDVRVDSYNPGGCSAIRRVLGKGAAGATTSVADSGGSTGLLDTLASSSSAANLLGMNNVGTSMAFLNTAASASSTSSTRSGNSPSASDHANRAYHGGAINSPKQFANALLNAMGISPTASNTSAIVAWANAEGGNWHNTAHYNPLNTTQMEPGASSMNSVGVKAYTSWSEGINATVKTLENGYYGKIIGALEHGSAADIASAIVHSKWGTHNIYLGKQDISSHAAGAWDVPSNELAMIHKGEMVLPARVASQVRSASGKARAGGGPVTINVYPANADHAAARRLAEMVKDCLDEEHHMAAIGHA